MRFSFVLSVTLTLVVSSMSCKKHEPAPTPTAAVTDPAVDPAVPAPSLHGPGTMPASPEPVVIADSGDVNSTLHDLSLELRKSVVRTRKVPKTFEEFLAQSKVQPPPPPAGKKYSIHGQEIILVNR